MILRYSHTRAYALMRAISLSKDLSGSKDHNLLLAATSDLLDYCLFKTRHFKRPESAPGTHIAEV